MLCFHTMQSIFVINVVFCYKFDRAIICFHKDCFFFCVRTIVFIWFQFPKQVWTLQLKDIRTWGCEDTNKHTEYTSPRIRGCEDTRLLASTHEPKDMRMQGCKRGHMNLRIWGCKDATIQASTRGHKDVRTWRCKDISKCTDT